MHKSFFSIKPVLICFCCWLLGLTIGMLSSANADASVISLMRQSVSAPVSIVLLLWWSLVPFLIAAYAVKIQNFLILYTLLTVLGFTFGFVLALCFAAFYSAAWLVFPMLYFSQWLTAIALNVFAVRWLSGERPRLKRDLIFCGIFIAFVVILDFYSVSPFLAELMNT